MNAERSLRPTAFEALTTTLITPAVSALFRARVHIHFLINIPPRRPHPALSMADSDSIKATLNTTGMRGCTADNFSSDNPVIFDGLVADLVAAVAGSGTSSVASP